MAKFILVFTPAKDENPAVLTIMPGDHEGDDAVAELIVALPGEPAEATVRPQPEQHIQNVLHTAGAENIRAVIIKNESGEEYMDRFAKDADENYIKSREEKNTKKVIEKPESSYKDTVVDTDETDNDNKTE